MIETFLQAQTVFPDQVTTSSLAQNIVYAAGTVGALGILAGLMLVDLGGVRRVNAFDAMIQKLIGFFIGFSIYFLIGFAIWNWQYYVAFEVPDPYLQSIKDWWLGGTFATALAQQVDPASMPALNNQQIFIFFLACFAGIINVLIHLAVTERIKAAAFYVVSAVAAVMSSVLSWLIWGSTGPITNLGYHDFFGSGFVYVFAGALALMLVLRVGKRPGMYRPHPRIGDFRSSNLGISVVGVVLIFAGLPMVILSCGFFFDPEALFVSVTMADTSIGIAFNNLGLSWAGGALTGALIAYKTKKYIYTVLGPFAGYVSGAPAFDVYDPVVMFLVAAGAPFVSYAVYEWTQRREIDEHKLINLFLGVGSYGILMIGVIEWGTPQSGFFGITEGAYAFQHAEINLLWQAVGLATAIVFGLVTGWLLAVVLDKTIGLAADEEVQVVGFDRHDWDLVHDFEPQVVTPATVGVAQTPATVGAGNGPGSSAVGNGGNGTDVDTPATRSER